MTKYIFDLSKIHILLRVLLLNLKDALEQPVGQVLVLSGLYIWLPPNYWPMLAAVIVLTVAHEFGHWIDALILRFPIETFSLGMPFSARRLYLGKIWGTKFQVTPYWLFGGFVSFDPTSPDVLRQPIWKRAMVLSGGIRMNLIVAVGALALSYGLSGKAIYHAETPVVAELHPGAGLARDAGILPGDLIKSLNGKVISTSQQFIGELSQRTDEQINIEVQRLGETKQFALRAAVGSKLGIMLGQTEFVPVSPKEALVAATEQTGRLLSQMGDGLLMLAHVHNAPANVDPDSVRLHSIVAFIQVGANAYSHGMADFFYQVGVLSVMLAVFNLLPIPLLDGGHLLFLGVEGLRGKPVSVKTQGRLCRFFLYVLLGLALIGFYNDYAHPIMLG